MNPSYFRINISLNEAIKRLEKWEEKEFEKISANAIDAVDMCLAETGSWKAGACLFVYENDGWTIFEDLKGSYSDLKGGKVLKEFMEDFDNPDFNRNNGMEYEEIQTWIDVASFVDEDDLAFSADEGIVLI